MSKRADAVLSVRGEPIFTADLIPEEALYVKAVRSKYAHALIRHVDVSDALKVRGVKTVLTAKDVPGENLASITLPDRPFLAVDRVRSIADPIALVVADDPLAADEAAELVKVEYEPLPVVRDPLSALAPDAPKIHEDGNMASHAKVRKGNVEQGFAESDIIVENTYRTPYQEPAPLETEAAYAIPEPDGGVRIIGSIQNPFYTHWGVARILGLPREKVRVVAAAIGGSFGGKSDEAPWEICAMTALAALKTGRPAACVYGRDESIIAHSKRHPFIIRHKLGATRDGLLKAAEVEIYADTGAYASVGPFVLMRAVVHATGPYEIPNVKIDGYLVYTNNTVAGSMRGFGNPQAHFAAESQMDILARKLGMDPLELRLKNILRKGSTTATGQVLREEVGLEECLRRVAERLSWNSREYPRDAQTRRGYGIAAIYHGNSLGPEGLDRASARVAVDGSGAVRVMIGLTEYGTGATSGLAQIAAEALGIRPEKVAVERVDTSRVPESGGTFASRTTVMGGNAVRLAAERLRAKLERMADEAGYKIENGESLLRFVSEYVGEEVAEYAEFTAPECDYDPEKGYGTPYVQYTYGAVGVVIDVDTELGTIAVRRVVAAFDVGRAVNPTLVEGQIEGAIAQGVGYALTEELIHGKAGKVLNPNLADYCIPTSLDAPPIEAVIVEYPGIMGGLGAKAIAEPPISGPAPAIANAVEDAVGVRITSLPITAEKLLAAIRGRAAGRQT